LGLTVSSTELFHPHLQATPEEVAPEGPEPVVAPDSFVPLADEGIAPIPPIGPFDMTAPGE